METPHPADDFDLWVEKVRDPATKANEGKRLIRAGKEANASYEIAPLPDGRFAVKVRYAYEVGDTSTASSPWLPFATREECIRYFLDGARSHFREHKHLSGTQAKVQRKMAELLGTVLVFVEPPVEGPDPAEEQRGREGEERVQRQREAEKQRLRETMPLFASLLDDEA